jgi:hypothetical protein
LYFCLSLVIWHATPAAFAQSGPLVWVAPSLQRIGPGDGAVTNGTARLFAAKGEYESFQIVVRAPAGGLSNVDVTVTDLRSAGGAVIPKRTSLFTASITCM